MYVKTVVKLNCIIVTVCSFDIQLVVNAWGDDLNSRPEERKRSIKGKLASATHMQTVSYIKPLFKKLTRRVCKLFDVVFMNYNII